MLCPPRPTPASLHTQAGPPPVPRPSLAEFRSVRGKSGGDTGWRERRGEAGAPGQAGSVQGPFGLWFSFGHGLPPCALQLGKGGGTWSHVALVGSPFCYVLVTLDKSLNFLNHVLQPSFAKRG